MVTKSYIFLPILYVETGIISDQGEYRFVKKKKKGNILLLFIYSVVTTDCQHKCKL